MYIAFGAGRSLVDNIATNFTKVTRDTGPTVYGLSDCMLCSDEKGRAKESGGGLGECGESILGVFLCAISCLRCVSERLSIDRHRGFEGCRTYSRMLRYVAGDLLQTRANRRSAEVSASASGIAGLQRHRIIGDYGQSRRRMAVSRKQEPHCVSVVSICDFYQIVEKKENINGVPGDL